MDPEGKNVFFTKTKTKTKTNNEDEANRGKVETDLIVQDYNSEDDEDDKEVKVKSYRKPLQRHKNAPTKDNIQDPNKIPNIVSIIKETQANLDTEAPKSLQSSEETKYNSPIEVGSGQSRFASWLGLGNPSSTKVTPEHVAPSGGKRRSRKRNQKKSKKNHKKRNSRKSRRHRR